MVGDAVPRRGVWREWNSWGGMGSAVGVEFVVRCGGAVGVEFVVRYGECGGSGILGVV